jgi:hypothetical protein
MTKYRYHFYDLRTGVHIDTLPLENVTFTVELRGVGTLTGDLPLYGEGLSAGRVRDATIPDRTKIFVERDNALVWGGRLVPPRDYDSATGRMTITAEQTLGVFEQRYLPSLTYAGVDQLDIARDLLTVLQAESGGDMGVVYSTDLSGVLRTRTYSASDKTTGLQALTDLSEVIDGFEFATQVVWGPTAPLETVLFGYPRLGRAQSGSGLVLEYDHFSSAVSNVASYTWSDGPGLATRVWATSETDEGVQLATSVTNTDLVTAGYPLLERSEDFEGVTQLSTLQAHAEALSEFGAGHHVTAQFTVKAGPGMELGDWTLGDDTLVRISDWRFPPDPATGTPGFADYLRLVAADVTPGEEGAETYVFTMADFIEAL